MAPEVSRPHRFLCRNLLSLNLVEDELTRDPGPVGGPHSDSISSALSLNPISGPDLVSALVFTSVPALIPAPALAPAPTNDLFRQFMKAYLESNQGPKQLLAEHKRLLKAKIPELYYGKLHMDCYLFC